MSEIVLTLKADGAPWWVLHADSPEDMEAMIDSVTNLTPKAVEAATAFKSAGSGLSTPRGGGGGRPGYAPKPAYSGGGASSGPVGDLTAILYVPFDRAAAHEELKQQGARWDADRKGWKVTPEVASKYPQFTR